jgi:EAL domain-containing protein (putative c-di-GMP-specific phosphodiesterase class I)
MSLSPSYFVTVDNLPHIAASYSEGLAGRMLNAVWERFEESLGVEGWGCVLGTWGLELTPSNPDLPCRQFDLEAALHTAATRPIISGGSLVLPSLACRLSRPAGGPVMGNPHFDVAQYRLDMSAAVHAFMALELGDLKFAEQPVVAADGDNKVLYHECLARLCDSDSGVILPGAYMPSLERLGLCRAFDRLVVRSIIEQLRQRPDAILGCNISGQSVVRDFWWATVLAELEANPDIAHRLVVEITETALPESAISAVNFVQALRRTGCRVAIDDFGAGFSSISFAREVKADIIKIDGSYVRRRGIVPGADGLLGHLVALAKDLSSSVVIEGIESEADLHAAAEAGGDWLQGYFFRLSSAPSVSVPPILPLGRAYEGRSALQ